MFQLVVNISINQRAKSEQRENKHDEDINIQAEISQVMYQS